MTLNYEVVLAQFSQLLNEVADYCDLGCSEKIVDEIVPRDKELFPIKPCCVAGRWCWADIDVDPQHEIDTVESGFKPCFIYANRVISDDRKRWAENTYPTTCKLSSIWRREGMSDLVVVCDLEATCWEDGETQTIERMEVIEIGCLLIDFEGNQIDEFSSFVRPVQNPILTDFCTTLTTIRQEDVDNAPVFCDAMSALDAWLDARSIGWASWGRFDCKLLLNQQQRYSEDFAFTKLPHLNIKDLWRRSTRPKHSRTTDLYQALAFHGLLFEGVPHRALTDAQNTAKLVPLIPRADIEREMKVR
ncbi:MAG: 3'-5' exonuclease [Pseudohongiella sp.]|nr:3'-5' exonuclease [Pseudohongiella sp.]